MSCQYWLSNLQKIVHSNIHWMLVRIFITKSWLVKKKWCRDGMSKCTHKQGRYVTKMKVTIHRPTHHYIFFTIEWRCRDGALYYLHIYNFPCLCVFWHAIFSLFLSSFFGDVLIGARAWVSPHTSGTALCHAGVCLVLRLNSIELQSSKLSILPVIFFMPMLQCLKCTFLSECLNSLIWNLQ